jgi:hypothetical protein
LQLAQTLIEKNINKMFLSLTSPQRKRWHTHKMTGGGMENTNIYFRYTDASLLVMGLVLHDLLLSIAAGSYFVLFGLSGGGKSTLLKLMTGLLRPDKGGVSGRK